MGPFIKSLFAGILGALLVFGANYYFIEPQSTATKTEVVRTEIISGSGESKNGSLPAEQIYQRYGDGVVHIQATITETYDNFFGLPLPDNQTASGSGFIISRDGYVVTNAHVVSGADTIRVQLADQAVVEAKLIGLDTSSDLALLKIDPAKHKFKVLELGDSKKLRVGETVYAIGNPLGYDRSMSSGIVSALNREIEAPNGFPIRSVIQTDAAINKGNSGGPLISSRGRVVGVTSQIASTGNGNIGIAFAVPSVTVKKVTAELREKGKASHAWLGIQGANLQQQLASESATQVKEGAIVVSVASGGPAEKAGLKGAQRLGSGPHANEGLSGDIITEINGTKVKSMDDLISEIAGYGAGDTVTLTIVRNKEVSKIKVKLEERPDDIRRMR